MAPVPLRGSPWDRGRLARLRFLFSALLLAVAPALAAPPATLDVSIPDVRFVDAADRPVALRDLLAHDGPVVLQLVFTTCPAVCPLLTGTAVAAARRAPDVPARFVAVSIDPEHDTPARLREYAARFGADRSPLAERFVFLTGRPDDVRAVQGAFGADRGEKMRHEPMTFLRVRPGAVWTRLPGYPTADELVEALRPAPSG